MRPTGRGSRRPGTRPRFAYFLETAGQPVTPEHPVWTRPLPLSRRSFSGASDAGPAAFLSTGRYFEAVRTFLEGMGWDAILRSLEGKGVDASSVETFRIFLAKHGEYYHPARVEAEIVGRPFQWVVNVALSAAGKSLLVREHAILERLNREFRVSYLPQVYGAGEVDAGHGQSLAMFLGQWFCGFHEFHLTCKARDTGLALVLWDVENGPRHLDRGEARVVYSEVARILTHYFSLTTLEGIGAWHHAAGDFVVRLSGAHPEVRLITVREYQPLFRAQEKFGDPADRLQALLEALLIFLLNLTIRTRLDRLDGTGDMVWSESLAVEATVTGMLAGLAEKQPPFELPLPLDQLFQRYLASCSADDLLDLCRDIAAKACPLGRLETRLKGHTATLARVLSRQ